MSNSTQDITFLENTKIILKMAPFLLCLFSLSPTNGKQRTFFRGILCDNIPVWITWVFLVLYAVQYRLLGLLLMLSEIALRL